MGKAHFKKADFWKAIDSLTEAIKLDHQLIDAYNDRFVSQVLEKGKEHQVTLLHRAACYDIVGLTKEAQEDKQRCGAMFKLHSPY